MHFKERFREKIAYLASLIEILISAIVLIAILITGWQVLKEAFMLSSTSNIYDDFTLFLGHAFNLVIGVEFIKMLSKHTPGSAIEVLLFTIARQMVIEHTSPVGNLITIVTVAIIFAIRKFLFVPSFGAHAPNGEESSAFDEPSHAISTEKPDISLSPTRYRKWKERLKES